MMTCHQQGKECKEIEIHCPRQDRGRGHPLWRSYWRKLHPEQSQERISPARCSTIETEAIRGGMAPPETQWIIPATVFPDQEEAGEEGSPTILFHALLPIFPQRTQWAEAEEDHHMTQELVI